MAPLVPSARRKGTLLNLHTYLSFDNSVSSSPDDAYEYAQDYSSKQVSLGFTIHMRHLYIKPCVKLPLIILIISKYATIQHQKYQ